jgi:hypothetical protein
MKRKIIALIVGFSFLFINHSFAQATKEDVGEARLQAEKKLQKPAPDYKLSTTAGIFYGYDSNPNLGSQRKGDSFQEFIYSLNFMKPLGEDLKLTFDYDLDYLNYSEFTDVTSLLNHLRLGLHKKLSFCTIGGGYDFAFLYYPKDDEGNFVFNKGFLYARKDFSSRMYHKLEVEYGVKDFTEKKALAKRFLVKQNTEQQDDRFTAAYDIGYRPTRKLTLRLKNKFYYNDSNAIFMDFYDYIAHSHGVSADYKLWEKWHLLAKFDYRRKDYDERLVVRGTSKQKDDLYTAAAGAIYNLDDKNSLSLYYIYRDNNSNEPMEEYVENVVTCGWQHYF